MRDRLRLVAAAALVLALIGSIGVGRAGADDDDDDDGRRGGKPRAEKVIMFAADGMRPDLVETYADKGVMPTMRNLMRDGVRGDNGLLQGFPPNTGVGWHTLATGTWAGEHGSTNNTFHRTGEGNFNNSTSFATTGILQADHIAQSAERDG